MDSHLSEPEARLPKHLRQQEQQEAMESLIRWWHATVGSAPMSLARVMGMIPYPSRVHAACVTLTESGDPTLAMVESKLMARLTGKLYWRNEDDTLRLHILMSGSGILFQVAARKTR